MTDNSTARPAAPQSASLEELAGLLVEVAATLSMDRTAWLAAEREILAEALTPLGVDTNLIPESLLKFRASLNDESDRGCALAVAAYLDGELGVLLRHYLVDDEKALTTVLTGNGGLASFSSRIEMAYLLGLIGPAVRRDLHLIRRIRNEFAHVVERVSFREQQISARCDELRQVGPDPDAELPPRKRYIRATMGVAAGIHAAIKKAERRVRMRDVDVDNPAFRARSQAMSDAVERVLTDHFGAP